MTLYLDTETRSETPIKAGTYRYCEDAFVDIITWALDDGPVQCWDATDGSPFPIHLSDELQNPSQTIICHNAMFDRNIIYYAAGIWVPIHRWRCTMTRAHSHALPGSLDKLCEILKVPQDQAKLKTGRDLMLLFCKPRPKNSVLRWATRETHPQQRAEYLEYAKHDILAMREIDKRLPTWNMARDYPADGEPWTGAHKELALWHRDQEINDRGFLIDMDLARAALRATGKAQASLKARCQDATGYDAETGEGVAVATQRDKMLEFILLEHGIELPDMKSSTLERRMNDPDLPDGLRDLLSIRLQACSTSTGKYKSLLKAVNDDGRLRGTIQFAGAGRTRRDAGRTFQPQNLPSKNLLEAEEIEPGIEALKLGCEDMLYDNVMQLLASTIRGCIIAPPGKKLVIADLANIEGRMLAWMGGEGWKLQAFRDFDTILGYDDKGEAIRKGEDLYKIAYAKSFGVLAESVTKPQRQIGKVQELALGYAGGVGAFITFALAYDIDLERLAEEAYPGIPSDVLFEAEGFYDWTVKKRRSTFGLSRRAFVVCDAFKRLWRAAHPGVVSFWRDFNDGCVSATKNPGETFRVRGNAIRRDKNWLRVLMPSGRYLCYPSPQLDDKGALSYMGVNTYTKKWQRIQTHGGKLAENEAQSMSRDVLFDNLPRIEAAGYGIILRVHDEVVTEAPDSPEFGVEHLSSLLSTNHDWCPDLPLAAAGFEAKRYGK